MNTLGESGYRTSENADTKPIINWPNLIPDAAYLLGLGILCISFLVFLYTKNIHDFSIVLVMQVFAIFYTVFLLITKKMRFFWKPQPKEYLAHRLLSWQIWVISCFTLNREVDLFDESAEWLSIALVVSCLSNIVYYWEPTLSKRYRSIACICWAGSSVLWLYFTSYTLFLYPISLLFILFLGLGFHSFVPILLLIAHVKLLKRAWNPHNNAILFGVVTPVFFTIFFTIQWGITQNKIQEVYQKSPKTPTDEIPSWVIVAQKIENNWITERILKSDLVFNRFKGNFDFMPRRKNFESTKHDPLIMIATLFNKEMVLSPDEKIKILEVTHDAHHESQQRLWAGDLLITKEVVTQARIYPEYRLAYTEKTLTIVNTSKNPWQNQEAIYTFYLPEGAVASSLSLWINGKEEKGYLTTQAKAETAYNTIVGIETRDPSVIHWQEGNALSLRVFPCTSDKPRQVKIGITSPIKEKNGKLIYENIHFKGPNASNATETVMIDFSQPVNALSEPWGKQSVSIKNKGNYKSYWQISFKTPELSKNTFSFRGKNYELAPMRIQKEKFNPDRIYLDINAQWSKAEFDDLYSILKNKEVWIWNNRFIKLDSHNKDQHFYDLKHNLFSLFPLYRIHPQSLLITKGTTKAPNLKEIENSGFAQSIKNINISQGPVQVLSLNETLSPYLKTLKELGVIIINQADIDELQDKQLYKIIAPQEASVSIESARIQIKESATVNPKGQAPDHLLRLYAYNHIMQQIGVNYFKKDYLSDSLIHEASTANIVTPVSSLIVLETQADYNRFKINQNTNGLQNASLKSSGSVPEPHEWLLIISFACIVFFLILKRQ